MTPTKQTNAMRYQFKLGGTAFECIADPNALDGEDVLGNCEYHFSSSLADELAPIVFEQTNGYGYTSRATLAEAQRDRTGEQWQESGDLTLEADGGITALAYLIAIGNRDEVPWLFEWDGSGSVFWLFHDCTHALEDWTIGKDSDGWTASIQALTAWAEDRANLEGARRALGAGVPVEEVIGELAGLAEAFSQRFEGEASTALDDLLNGGLPGMGDGRAEYAAHVLTLATDYAESLDDDVSPDDVDPFEWVDGDGYTPGLVLAFCSHGSSEDYGEGIEGRAFSALLMDVSGKARELITCPECDERRQLGASTCKECNED